MTRPLAVVVLGALILSACGGDSGPAAPSQATVNLSGTWVGAISDSLAGNGSVRMTLTQGGNGLTGSFATVYPIGNGGGSLNGTVTGSAVSATVQPSVANQCPFTVNATMSGSSLSGTFAAFSCSGVETGSFSVTKQ